MVPRRVGAPVGSPHPVLEYRQHGRGQQNFKARSECALQFWRDKAPTLQAELDAARAQLAARQAELVARPAPGIEDDAA